MSLIITNGFQTVDLRNFRRKSITKGSKLVRSYHVSNVREIVDGNNRKIDGSVLRETPGVASTKKNENVYSPVVTIDHVNGRIVRGAKCTCKAGMLFCKHAAAICIFVNEENTLSKTATPMIWNRPPEHQLAKYRKGCTLESLFPSNRGNIQDRNVYRFKDVQNITDVHMNETCSFINMIKAEKRCTEEKEAREQIKEQQERANRAFLSRLLSFQCQNSFRIHHAWKFISNENVRHKLAIVECPSMYANFYQENVVVNQQKWVDICFSSLNQSKSPVWISERVNRITCSEKAHRIKTRRENFDELAVNLHKSSFEKISTKQMRYGLNLEPLAKMVFKDLIHQEIYDTGLVICYKQPFLACSPDGLIFNGEDFELLEIKCPFSCANSLIIDYGTKQSFVDYLRFDDNGKIVLKEKHKYYTQIQVSMYVVGLNSCHFFVYSIQQHVHLNIQRDEEFLSVVIPKIEKFYFENYIKLCKSSIIKD